MNTLRAPEWLPSFLIPFFTLSYPTAPPAAPDSFPNASYYGVGILDGCFIITCIAAMAMLRDLTRLYISEPFARWKLTRDLNRSKRENIHVDGNGKPNGKTNGVANGNGAAHKNGSAVSKKEAKKIYRSVVRFAEQGWSAISYTALFSLGLYVHRNVPTKVLHPRNVWLNYPNIPIAAPTKFYYLLESAFYVHQVLILNAEARRKDHWQMMTHHVITVLLMIGSYVYNLTRVGCLIMLLMDWCDVFLALAKMFRYLALSTLCDATFTFFLLSWLVTRHVLFILAIKCAFDARPFVHSVLEKQNSSRLIYDTFLAMLSMLQGIQLMWFWMICRVAWRVVSGQGAEDTRSDDEEDGENHKTEHKKD
ncbi:TLC domain-containing protein [Sparassis latifolia]|uniref:Sphingosine N-acyltransferase lag1 n=1 Tax=Sparassis crispa TaxID=139825 RepID=A0A401GB65_9APHY|nr:Sphingosine N-acyltransferase lag1 [Sparassis crispa]GBE79426.1 Sphingosine N-acyltransferase lag1 [Sparassis crispa]